MVSTVLVGAAAVLGTAPAALAAPGDANARGVVLDLSADVLGTAVISADATIGTATAPAGGGTDNSTLVPISVPGAVGVTAGGTVQEVAATRAAASSSASSRVNGLGLTILGIDTITATEITAAVTCPRAGTQSAATTVTGLELFGSAVTLVANGATVSGSASVTVPGLLGADLNAALTRTETTTASGAAATAVLAAFNLTGTLAGQAVTIPVGTAILAQATCERPLAPVPPTAATIAPDSGPQSGGQTVTITGTGFVPGGTTVTFDGVPGTNVVVAAGGASLTAVTPAGQVGPAAVVVSTAGGSATPLDYTYLANGSDATVTGLTPTSGPTAGGTTVTITGTGFTGATAVDFDGQPSTGFTIDPAGTTVTVVSPPNPAGPALVELIFPAGRVNAGTFTYIAPAITSITPDQGPSSGGTSVTITGTGFGTATGVNFGDAPGTNLVVDPSGTSLTVVTPPGSVGPVDVTVLIPGADAIAPNGFTYQASVPTASAIAPDSGPRSGGQTVTITGTGFVPGATTVTFNSVPATNVVVAPAGTSLTAVTPPGPVATVPVLVSTAGGSAAPLDYTYLANGGHATVTGLAPTSGPTSGGTVVTITGTGLGGATGVNFGDAPGTNLVVDPSGTSLTVVTPPGTVGPVDVTVLIPGGNAVAPDGFAYVAAPPVIDAVDPGQGGSTGGTIVTIGGSGFVPGQTVVIICGRTIPASEVTVAPDGRSLTFRTPACPAGDTTVTVTTPEGTSNGVTFRYVGPSLPVTGSAIEPLVEMGLGVVIIGAVLLMLARRRREGGTLA